MKFGRIGLIVLALIATVMAFGQGQITVNAPTDNSFIGTTNLISFHVVGATSKITIHYSLTGTNGTTTFPSVDFIPDTNNKVDQTVPLDLNRSFADGAYTLQVTCNEPGNPANVYNTPPVIHLKAILTPPKMLDFSPINGQFVKGIVPITVSTLTNFPKDYRVQVNNQDIPGNSGTTNNFVVNWDTANILTDGPQTISVTVRDLALNTLTQSINVTLDRIAPVISIQFPTSGTIITRHQRIPFIIDVQDATTNSVDVTGIDVTLKDTLGHFITRVPRISALPFGNNVLRWQGRIKIGNNLPPQFVLNVTAIDKAGNVGTSQTLLVKSTN
jgi:hypothetical protein